MTSDSSPIIHLDEKLLGFGGCFFLVHFPITSQCVLDFEILQIYC